MKGLIDNSGRALVKVVLRPDARSPEIEIEAWIDTGFTGDLVLPEAIIDKLNLEASASVDAVLADGSSIEVNTYGCLIDWFGNTKRLEVIANNGDHALLGVGLLLGLELRADYRNLELSLVPAKKRTTQTG